MSCFTGGLDREFDRVDPSWREVTEPFRRSERGRRLIEFVDARVAAGAMVYPPQPLRALALTPRDAVRAVIVGQDPYHGPGQAEGLAFSVAPGQRLPPSLRNLFKEIGRDLGGRPAPSGSLLAWAQRGVLLLNSVLTVEDGRPASHTGRGWEALTDAVVEAVWQSPAPTAFLLWGAAAQSKLAKLDPVGKAHRVWRSNHPSPLSATRGPEPFIGCGHFGASARFLEAAGRPLNWRLDVAADSGIVGAHGEP
ncbi:MAG TPA: uracil-DNA glycosylase [Methylibium sp.]|uniref:uracil-DNA glycosylase n=1 Tax=Methylibium sp. TaxID=2067992 RepID=UPI002DB60FB0|nr:uracil-DNA glycosylase [Methylibium sp.]HEU4457514.1 uracil-DNA glycosylase [Methylibium sp.]